MSNAIFKGINFEEIKEKYVGKGYGEFKGDLAEIVANEVGMVQENFKKFSYFFAK